MNYLAVESTRLSGKPREPPARVPVVVVSRFDDWQRYLNFLQTGAFDYVLYPPSGSEIERVVQNALSCGPLERAKGSFGGNGAPLLGGL